MNNPPSFRSIDLDVIVLKSVGFILDDAYTVYMFGAVSEYARLSHRSEILRQLQRAGLAR